MYRLVELFSGIGSQVKAMKNIGMEPEVLGTCEWDIHAMVAYDAIHNSPETPEKFNTMTKEELLDMLSEYSLSNDGKKLMQMNVFRQYSVDVIRRVAASIERSYNFVDINSLTGKKMPRHIDIMTYSFPCQDLSNVGAFHGYNKGIDKESGSRSSLLWQVGRILSEMKHSRKKLPRYLLMENVPTLLSARHLTNFKMWIEELKELGYVSFHYELNASSFGLPQNRPRLLMISVYVGKNKAMNKKVQKFFLEKTDKDIIHDYQESEYYHPQSIKDLLKTDYTVEKYFDEACECTPNATVSRQKIWDENPQLVLKGNVLNENYTTVRTITTKQDRHPNSGNLYFESGIEGRGNFRYLTPRECFLFMGFDESDFDNVICNNPLVKKNSILFPRDKLIRMAGNSIPVKLLEGIYIQIKMLDEILYGCS